MSLVTLRVLDGADRGRVFEDVPTPFTVGREEGNPIQLNDERISRFHLKIQEDQDRVVLTDLESTNGTKVNGESVQLWVLRPGDVIALGRTVLLYGSRLEIAERLAALRGVDLSAGVELDDDEVDKEDGVAALDFELNYSDDPAARTTLHTLLPPELPNSLSPGQAAQLAEVLQFFHLRLRALLDTVKSKPKSGPRDARSAAVAEPARPAGPPRRVSPRHRRTDRLARRHLEAAHQVAECGGLGPEFLAAGGHFLAAGGRLLGHLGHGLDGLRDLLGVGRLLDRGRGDLGRSAGPWFPRRRRSPSASCPSRR